MIREFKHPFFETLYASPIHAYDKESINTEAINFKVNLAGTEKEDIALLVEDDMLIVKVKEKEYNSFKLHKFSDLDNISATYKNGLLRIGVPKKVEKREIKVE